MDGAGGLVGNLVVDKARQLRLARQLKLSLLWVSARFLLVAARGLSWAWWERYKGGSTARLGDIFIRGLVRVWALGPPDDGSLR